MKSNTSHSLTKFMQFQVNIAHYSNVIRATFFIVLEYFSVPRNLKKKKIHQFQRINREHIEFIQKAFRKEKTRHLSIEKKLRMVKDEFPELLISRSTLYTI